MEPAFFCEERHDASEAADADAGALAGSKLRKGGGGAAEKIVKSGGISLAPGLKPSVLTPPVVRVPRTAPARRFRPLE